MVAVDPMARSAERHGRGHGLHRRSRGHSWFVSRLGNSGLVNDLDGGLAPARAFIEANPSCQQPWDKKGYKLPGGAPQHPAMAQKLAIAPAMLKQKTKGCYPAPERILSAAVEGAQVHFDAGSPDAADPIDRVSSRPDFLILCYPVISFTTPFTHRGSMRSGWPSVRPAFVQKSAGTAKPGASVKPIASV